MGGLSVAARQLLNGGFLLGLSLAGRAGTGLDVEVLQDVVVDLGGDLLLLQHLLDGLVGGVGPDGGPFLRGSLGLRGISHHAQSEENQSFAMILHTP